jgi:hypothetical protein
MKRLALLAVPVLSLGGMAAQADTVPQVLSIGDAYESVLLDVGANPWGFDQSLVKDRESDRLASRDTGRAAVADAETPRALAFGDAYGSVLNSADANANPWGIDESLLQEREIGGPAARNPQDRAEAADVPRALAFGDAYGSVLFDAGSNPWGFDEEVIAPRTE